MKHQEQKEHGYTEFFPELKLNNYKEYLFSVGLKEEIDFSNFKSKPVIKQWVQKIDEIKSIQRKNTSYKYQRIIFSNKEIKNIQLSLEFPVIIGRNHACSLVISTDKKVSANHAKILEKNGEILIFDLGSSNGTYLNGARVFHAQSINTGDIVTVGETEIHIVLA